MTSSGSESSPRAASRSRFFVFTVPRFTLFLTFAVAVAFWEVVLGQQTFVFRDYGLFGYPLAFYNRELFWQGELPLWNPLSNCGLPYLAQWNTMTLYPLGIFYLLFPLQWALPVFCLGHLVLGGVGMYVLCRAWIREPVASAVAGVAYAFSGLMLNSLMWPNNIAALGLLPWVVWSAERAVRSGWRFVFIAALIGAVQMLAGAPEVILFTWAIAGLMALLALAPERNYRSVLAGLARLAAVVGLTAALAMAQLLPFLQLLEQSHRSAGVVGYESAMPPWGWANFLVPLFHTYKSNSGVHFQAGQVWTSSYYISIIALYLALLGVARRSARSWALWAVALLSLVMAAGHSGFVYTWVREAFPQIAIMNFPIKFVVPILFAIPALAAYGTAFILEKERSRAQVIVGAVMLMAIGAIASWARTRPLEPGEWPVAGWNALGRGVFLLLGAGLLLLQKPAHRVWAGALLLVCMVVDVATHMPWQNPTVTPGAYERDLNEVRRLDPVPAHGQSRAMLTGQALNAFRFAMQRDAFRTYVGHRLGLYDNCNLLEALPKTDGFFSLYLPEESRVRGILNSRTNLPTGLLNLMGVSHYSNPTSIINFVRRDGFLPMVTIGQAPVFTDWTNVLRGIFREDFNPSGTVYFLNEATNAVNAREKVAASIQELQIRPERLLVRYTAPADTVVSIAQSWYPNWRATVDGAEAPILMANHAFQAVPVPAGEHVLEVRYVDTRFRAGLIVSGVALAFCLTGLWLTRKSSAHGNDHFGDGKRAQG